MGIRFGLNLFKEAFWNWWNDNTFRLAASLAFYTIFSLAPILIIVVEIAAFVFSREQVQGRIVTQIEQLAGPQAGVAVQEVLQSAGIEGGSAFAVTVGVVTILLGSTAVFVELQSALNLVWGVKANPQGSAIKRLLRVRLRSFSLALGVGFLLLVSLVLSAVLSGVEEYLAGRLPLNWLWQSSNFLVSFFVIALLFAMIYKYLPDVQITWKDVAIGSMVTALLFTLGKFMIGLYLGRATFGSRYGAAGSFVVLLLWVYYSALISFLGAEFTQVYARRVGSRIRPESYAVRVGKNWEDAENDT